MLQRSEWKYKQNKCLQNYARHVFMCSQCSLVTLVKNYTDPKVHLLCPWSAKCFHISSSHFLAFLCELSKKVLTISKQGL